MERSWYQKLWSGGDKAKPEKPRQPVEPEDADTQFSLGLHFANRQETEADYGTAAQWYRKAADQNHSLAQFNLGIMYAGGHGVARDEAVAAQWFRKAALQGDAGGQYKYAQYCQRESYVGVPGQMNEAKIEAYKWFHLSAEQEYGNSRTACNAISFSMSREEVTEGLSRAAAFLARLGRLASAV